MISQSYRNATPARILSHNIKGFFINETNDKIVSLLVQLQPKDISSKGHETRLPASYTAFTLDEIRTKKTKSNNILSTMARRLDWICSTEQTPHLEDALRKVIKSPLDENGFKVPMLRNLPIAGSEYTDRYYRALELTPSTTPKQEVAKAPVIEKSDYGFSGRGSLERYVMSC